MTEQPPRLPPEPLNKPLPPGELIATLPEDKRPLSDRYVLVNETGGLVIRTDGEIQWVAK